MVPWAKFALEVVARSVTNAQSDSWFAGRFHLRQELGPGGLGPLFRAEDIVRQHDVTLCFLPSGRSAEAAQLRIEALIADMSDLWGPSIAKLLDVGASESQPWVTEELIVGQTLEQRITDAGRLPPVAAARLVAALAEALARPHLRGIYHRDLKPRNVMLVADAPHLLGFGLSHAALVGPASVVSATPDMMPPEQVLRQDMDHRADVYSLGAVLYFAAVGEPPFKGGSKDQMIAANLGFRPPRPSDRAPEVPDGLELIILRAMARRKEDRYQSMEQFQDALVQWATSWTEVDA